MSQQYPNQPPTSQYGVYPPAQEPGVAPPPQYAQGQFLPPGQGQFPQPPKKKHTGRTILIVVGAVFGLLMVIGIAAGGGGEKKPAASDNGSGAAANQPAVVPPNETKPSATKPAAPKPSAAKSTVEASKAAPKPSAQPKPSAPANAVACAGQDDRNAPCVVQVGSSFQLGEHTVLAGWKIKDSGFGMTIVGKAKNTGDKDSTMFINVKFLRGDEVMANVMCNTGELAPGQSEAMNCLPDGTYTKKFDKVTAEAAF